ncbi:MAG TPA: MBL fold metallo-hydrolase [Solirubrobacteraceae bacterium]|jgi:hydroxyacylglutathione hydrolase|nr:MBL fold metallo-hydrolase [Solirubrobacteraceae bacterium]
MQARGFTVGPLAENCWVIEEHGRAIVVDPGDEADRLIETVEDVTVEAILLTHTHFDHVGAVAPMARHTGAPVYCPATETFVLRDINAYVFPGYGPYEPYDPERTLDGGEHLTLAGLDIDVLFTPGHSPGHVSFSIPHHGLVLSGDVLFQGSIGRTDLPGGDHERLMESIADLLDALPDDTRVLPGHMGVTTLGRERATNPFLLAPR